MRIVSKTVIKHIGGKTEVVTLQGFTCTSDIVDYISASVGK